MPHGGDKPGKGTYKCTKCWYTVKIEDDTTQLLRCPVCKNNEYIKIKS